MGNPQEFVASKYVEEVSAAEPGRTLVFSARSGRLISIDSNAWSLVRAGASSALTENTRVKLIESSVLVRADLDEYVGSMTRSKTFAAEARVMSRFIMPTAFCQLNCNYCGQEHSQQRLDDVAIDRLVGDIEARLATKAFDELTVTWFGGEPTTAPDVIEHISARLIECCAKHAVRFSARVITNGVSLTRLLAERLHQHSKVATFMISVDGPTWVHDRRRPTITGRGSRRGIMSNIRELVESSALISCQIRVRVNIDQDNAEFVHELIEELADLNFAPRVRIEFAIVVQWSHERTTNLMERAAFADKEVAWLSHLLSRGFAVDWLPVPKASPCLAAEPASFVVAPDGVAHNCAMTPLSPHSLTPTTQKFLDFSPMAITQEGLRRLDMISDLLQSPQLPCRTCSSLFLCQGGCPKELESGIVPCPTHKFNLKSRMRLSELSQQLAADKGDCLNLEFVWGVDTPLDRASIERSLIEHIQIFKRRFRLFRIAKEVRIQAGALHPDYGTAHVHTLLPQWHYLGLSAAIMRECAERFLSQLNPTVHSAALCAEASIDKEIAQGFVAWATAKATGEEPQVSDVMSFVAKRTCIDQWISLPVEELQSIWLQVPSMLHMEARTRRTIPLRLEATKR